MRLVYLPDAVCEHLEIAARAANLDASLMLTNGDNPNMIADSARDGSFFACHNVTIWSLSVDLLTIVERWERVAADNEVQAAACAFPALASLYLNTADLFRHSASQLRERLICLDLSTTTPSSPRIVIS